MKRPALVTAIALMAISLTIVAYRVFSLGYPILPAAPVYVWNLQFDAVLHGTGKNTLLLLSLPSEQHGQIILEESIGSGKLSFSLLREYDNRVGVWSGKTDEKGEYVSYRATVLFQHKGAAIPIPPPPGPYPQNVALEDRAVIGELSRDLLPLNTPSRLQASLRLLKRHSLSGPDGNNSSKAEETLRKYDNLTKLLSLLAAVNIPARTVEGLGLREGMVNRTLTWVEAWTGQRWEHIDPASMENTPEGSLFMPLSAGGMSAVRISGGELTGKRFDLRKNVMSRWRLFFERISRSNRLLDRWSLFRLPLEFQQTFRILLLVPLGALLISVLRNIVGIQTFGIFMPVLMALSFRSTGLIYGLTIFAAIILVGYMVRRYLNKLKLLLIPRMSVLVTLVIFCFTILALIGNKFGFREFMAVGLLPFVILTMTIERFFVVVEEHGMKTAFQTALGSAVVSVTTYLIIVWEPLQITFFVYPELMLFVMALQLLVGRYTGYRLSELIRFRSFTGDA